MLNNQHNYGKDAAFTSSKRRPGEACWSGCFARSKGLGELKRLLFQSCIPYGLRGLEDLSSRNGSEHVRVVWGNPAETTVHNFNAATISAAE